MNNVERLAKGLQIVHKLICSYCKRELIVGKDEYLANKDQTKVLCLNPCVIKATKLLKS